MNTKELILDILKSIPKYLIHLVPRVLVIIGITILIPFIAILFIAGLTFSLPCQLGIHTYVDGECIWCGKEQNKDRRIK